MVIFWGAAEKTSVVNNLEMGTSSAVAILAIVSIIGFFNALSISFKCAGLISAL